MTGSGLERAAWEAVRRGDRSGTVISPGVPFARTGVCLTHDQVRDAVAALLADWRLYWRGAGQLGDLTVPVERGGCPDWAHRKRNHAGGWFCPYAGRRNQQMVDTMPRATDVLVFPAAGPVARSRGTWDLHRRAVRAGLTVHPLVPLEVILWPPWTWRRVS